jgi:hypothetical protein
MRPVMMTGGFWARARGVNRSDKAKERNREQDGFCHNDFRLFFGIATPPTAVFGRIDTAFRWGKPSLPLS